MPHWIFKAIAQRTISLLPQSHFWNYLFQQYVTKSLDLVTGHCNFEQKIAQCKKHLDNYFSAVSMQRSLFSVVELGTGWCPIVPVGLYLCGASKIWTIDKRPLLSPARVEDVLRLFVEYNKQGKLVKKLPMIHKDRVCILESILDDKPRLSPAGLLEQFNIYAIQTDARQTYLEDASIDLFVSNNTLEHIPEDTLYDIFTEFRRIASPTAVMSHFIDMGDHYISFDSSITPYNFLKYSDALWKFFNNPLHYQNRLRISDYREIHQATGWKILNEQNEQGSTKNLQSITLAKKFYQYSEDELVTLSSWIISSCGQSRK